MCLLVALDFLIVSITRKLLICFLTQQKKWLEAKGIQAMDGPINFGERDRWWAWLRRVLMNRFTA